MKPWQMVWAIAIPLFYLFKVITLWKRPLGMKQMAIYLCLWPGMDPQALQVKGAIPPTMREWGEAILKTALGIALLTRIPFWLPLPSPYLVGWCGILGLIALLHFGIFHLISLLLRRTGIALPPIMNHPLRATSVADFWGRRWNRAFREMTFAIIFSPVKRRLGAAAALSLSFLVSGVLHELVISVPVRGGLGLPTLYFAIQAAAIRLERGPNFPLRHNRVWALAVTLLPAPLLFHRPFLVGAMAPMVQFLGGSL